MSTSQKGGQEAGRPGGDDRELVTLRFAINGTRANPYAMWGLRYNPFPMTAIHELRAGERQLASLGGDPILSEDDIRDRLRGFAPDFVERVIRAWVPGKVVHVTVTFPRARN